MVNMYEMADRGQLTTRECSESCRLVGTLDDEEIRSVEGTGWRDSVCGTRNGLANATQEVRDVENVQVESNITYSPSFSLGR